METTSAPRGRPRLVKDRKQRHATARTGLALSEAQAARVRAAYRETIREAGSQAALATALNCSQQSISGVMSGHVSLSMAALLSIHRRVLLADLIGKP